MYHLWAIKDINYEPSKYIGSYESFEIAWENVISNHNIFTVVYDENGNGTEKTNGYLEFK